MITDQYRVDNKVAIVTGASRGMGRAIALALAEAGADVVVVARNQRQIGETVSGVSKLGQKGLGISADITSEEEVRAAVDKVVSVFGRVDILCNNAGIVMSKPVVFEPDLKIEGWTGVFKEGGERQQTSDDWHRVLNTNLTSAFLLCQAVAPLMIRQRSGKIVNTSSTCADEGCPFMSAYCASKAGLSSLTRCLASEWGQFNINVNAVAPGVIDTEMSIPILGDPELKKTVLETIPLGRIGQPREVALLVLFLASSASDYITGQTLTIDGGAMGRGPDI